MKEAKEMATNLGLDPHFKVVRKRRKKRMFDENAEDEAPEFSEEKKFQQQLLEIVDRILCELRERFNSIQNINHLFGFLNGASFGTMSGDDLKAKAIELASKYKEDLDKDELATEVESFKYHETAENNLSGPPGKVHHPCPKYQRWHTAPLLLRGNQIAGAQQFPPAHYTLYRADPPEGCRVCEDASPARMQPPPSLMIRANPSRDNSRGFTPWNTAERNPLMTRNPTNGHIVDSGKGGNGLIAIPNQFGFDHTRVQRRLTVRENINCLARISQTKILTSTFHNSCDLRLKNCQIRTHRDHQLPAWSHSQNSSACAAQGCISK
ncbi:homophilic cell adhesion protein [Homalodisca vitripennis]|nr:homophilic cell adhesion protein [Homalodisca vitripennis]